MLVEDAALVLIDAAFLRSGETEAGTTLFLLPWCSMSVASTTLCLLGGETEVGKAGDDDDDEATCIDG